jgi:multicomponent Na+:H+ antiporter subunit D
MPFTGILFMTGAFAIIGVPPTCGFFSKWYLLTGGINTGHWEFVMALLLSTLINIALFFRILDKAIFVHTVLPDPEGREFKIQPSMDEAPLSMTIPGLTIAVAILFLGIFNQTIIHEIIRFALPPEFQ